MKQATVTIFLTAYNLSVIDRIACYGYRRIGVAVSGGADSVFLLHALKELEVATVLLHVNHGLRGAESDRDEEFVRALALQHGLPVDVLKAPTLTGNIEQEARRARYDFFAKQIAVGVCDAVATGHTLDDQAETVLYRFLRGAGTAGLSGIRPSTESGIIRPLIDLRREEIRSWLRDRNIPWQEDCTNQNPDFARNRIRLQHMPELAASLNPALPEVLAVTAQWAQGEEGYWAAELVRLAPAYVIETPETILISTKPFLELPVAVQRRLLRRSIERVRGSLRAIDFRHIEAVRAMMATREGSGRIQLPGLDIYRSFDWLRLAPIGIDSRLERDFESPLVIPGRTEVPERQLTIDMELIDNPSVYNSEVQALDWERCTGSLWPEGLRLRNWRPGDQYQPQGRSATEKIKTLFQEYRIPLWERRTWPVVVQGAGAASNTIVWSRRFGIAHEFAAGPGSRKILTIREAVESKPRVGASMLSVRVRDDQFRQPAEPGAEVL
ncbi:MAG TPA: tRNA lysidine(34) synthetase TilS [Bryobacteraceae bacterium]|jgi:tRNA(Ile)-lysidine synthase|nr:tRNA lysidine(34) synthetase TilS [Bryobacteraceae bacterium]